MPIRVWTDTSKALSLSKSNLSMEGCFCSHLLDGGRCNIFSSDTRGEIALDKSASMIRHMLHSFTNLLRFNLYPLILFHRLLLFFFEQSQGLLGSTAPPRPISSGVKMTNLDYRSFQETLLVEAYEVQNVAWKVQRQAYFQNWILAPFLQECLQPDLAVRAWH